MFRIAVLFAIVAVFVDASWFPLTDLTSPATNDTQYHELITPFMKALSLSYTATSGGYYNPSTANETVPGYIKSPLISNPACGMRALAFVSGVGGALPNIILVFRGTDLSGDVPSSTCDGCADTILFSNVTTMSDLPAECQSYTWDQLDYYTQAVRYTRQVMLAYPGSSIRFTGHSLGSALAAMMSTRLATCYHQSPEVGVNGGVIGVGTAGFVLPALNRMAGELGPSTMSPSWIVLLDQYYDPVYNTSTADGLYGTLCLWVSPDPPLPCTVCYASGNVSTSNLWCAACMAETHLLKAYLNLVASGNRPVCATTPEPLCLLGCAGSGTCLGEVEL